MIVITMLLGAAVFSVLNFLIWFCLSKFDSDKTTSGAYLAMGMIVMPIASLLGACVFWHMFHN